MKMVFQGLEDAFLIEKGIPFILEVNNPVLFARLCQSFEGNEGEFAVEPYTLWEGDERVSPKDKFLFVANVFDLPWDTRGSASAVHKQIESILFESEEIRLAIEQLNASIRKRCFEGSYAFHADYAFGEEWDLKRYLKAFAFDVDYNKEEPLLDNLIKFLSYIADIRFRGILVFVNLCSFLAERELEELLEHSFFLGLPLVLLESDTKSYQFSRGIHYRIDQELLGEYIRLQSVCPSSCREEFAPTVLEQ